MESDRYAVRAMAIVFGELNGATWNWDRMEWERQTD